MGQAPEAARQFVVGRWQVEQPIAGMEGASFADYFEDGSFSGSQQIFKGAEGIRVQIGGHWDFTKLANDEFRLALNFTDGRQWQGTFRILDHDRIHNIYENYVAVRVAR